MDRESDANDHLQGFTILNSYASGGYNYKLVRSAEDDPYLLIMQDDQLPTQVQQTYHHYRVGRELEHPTILEYYNIYDHQGLVYIMAEYFQGVPLASFLPQSNLSFSEVSSIFHQLISGLRYLHKQGLIHRQLSTSTILIQPSSMTIKITGFEATTTLERLGTARRDQQVGIEIMKFFSPETTGLTKFQETELSDYYSLGGILYSLLVREPPYNSYQDKRKVMRSILTVNIDFSQLVGQVNLPVSLVHMAEKLMQKNPRERYLSLDALEHDIKLVSRYVEQNQLSDPPVLDRYDDLARFYQTDRLIGRNDELASLKQAIDRSRRGDRQLLLLEGKAGRGKSSLLQNLIRIEELNHCIYFKLEQYDQTTQFTRLLREFENLIYNILRQNEKTITYWKTRIAKRLETTLPVLETVLPAIKHLGIDSQDLVLLDGNHAINRFNMVFQLFIEVLASQRSPLVIIIDDIHWMNRSIADFIQGLIRNIELKYFLLICSYRPEHIEKKLDLQQITELPIFNKITLQNLVHDDIRFMVLQFMSDANQLDALSHIILDQTGGNPLEVIHYILSLQNRGILYFSDVDNTWKLDPIFQSHKAEYSDYLHYIWNETGDQYEEVLQLMKIGSCLGFQFELSLLRELATTREVKFTHALEVAKQLGLILSPWVDTTVRFTHDSIQELFYNNIDKKEQQELHLQIGDMLLINHDENQEQLVEAIKHFNLSSELIEDPQKKETIAFFSYLVGVRLLRSPAYHTASKHFQLGLSLLPEEPSKNLITQLYRGALEAAYLNQDLELLDHLTTQVQTMTDQITLVALAYSLQIRLRFTLLQSSEIFEMGFKVLDLFDVRFTSNMDKSKLVRLYFNYKSAILDRGVDDLLQLEPITDELITAKIQILESMLEAVYTYKPELYPVFVFKILDITLKHGSHDLIGNCLANFAGIAGSIFDDIEFSTQLCEITLHLELSSRDKFIIYFSSYNWKYHYREALNPLHRLMETHVETGEFSYSGFASYQYSYLMMQIGFNYRYIMQKTLEFQTTFTKTNDQYNLLMNATLLDVLQTLAGQVSPAQDLEQKLMEVGNHNLLSHFYNLQLFQHYLLDTVDRNSDLISRVMTYLPAVIGSPEYARSFYYIGLTLHRQRRIQGQLDAYQTSLLQQIMTKFRYWNARFSLNFEHCLLLLEAEAYNGTSEFLDTSTRFEQAIENAKTKDYILDEALAYELAGKFYASHDLHTIFFSFQLHAIELYRGMGLETKVAQLRAALGEKVYSKLTGYTERIPGIEHTYSQLDHSSLIKSLMIISTETDYEKLVTEMMEVIFEQTGADVGMLFFQSAIRHREDWYLIAMEGKEQSLTVFNHDQVLVDFSGPRSRESYPVNVINYCLRTEQAIIVESSMRQESFFDDSYIQKHQIKNFMIIPGKRQNKIVALLFLANTVVEGVFKPSNLEFVELLFIQFIKALENALLYKQLENKLLVKESSIKKLERYIEEIKRKHPHLLM